MEQLDATTFNHSQFKNATLVTADEIKKIQHVNEVAEEEINNTELEKEKDDSYIRELLDYLNNPTFDSSFHLNPKKCESLHFITFQIY